MAYAKFHKQPIDKKMLLTVREAAAYSGIGIHLIEKMLADEGCSFLIKKGNRKMIKRKAFEEFIDSPDTKNI